jgi:hypothetical protein
MSGLPPGFVIDQPAGGLPPGFVLDQPSSKPKVGRSDGVAQSFGSGALFNFGDEVTAAVRAAFPGFSDWMMRGSDLKRDESIGGAPQAQTVSTKPTVGERYDEELGKERSKAKSFEESNPVLSTGANIAGNVAGAAATLPALPAGLVTRSVSPVVNVLKSAAVGAGYGGAAGYGAGEGDNRGGNALLGAGVGAVVGGVTPPVMAVGKRIMETGPGRYVSDKIITPAVNALSPKAPVPRSLSAAADGGTLSSSLTSGADEVVGNAAQRAAIDRVATAIQRSGRSPESFLRLVDRYGPEAVLADLDPALLSAAQGVKVLPGATRSQAETVLKARDKGAGQRVVRAFEGNEPPPSTYALRGEGQAFDQNARAVGNRAYGAMDDAGLKQTPELRALYENPYVDQALNQVMSVEKNARIGRPDAKPSSPVEIMHKVKQAIWDMGFDGPTARPGANASYYRDLGTDFVNKLKAANPKLAEADKAFAQAKSLPEFFDTGRNFLAGGTGEKGMNSSAPALADVLSTADPQQALAARAGSTNAAREVTGGRNALSQTRALTRDIEMSPTIRDKLVELYGPKRAVEIMNRAETENVFSNTSNKLLSGSQTAEKAADAFDMGNAGLRMTPEGVTPRAIQHLNALRDWVLNPNEAVRNEIGRALLNPNSAESKRILAAAAELLKHRRGSGPVRAGLSEGAAGNTTRD